MWQREEKSKMLFHLFSQHANGYVTFPSSAGPFTVSTQPGAGTAIDLCSESGASIICGARFSGNPDFANAFDVGAEDTRVNNNDRVTLRSPADRYMTPRGERLATDAPFAAHAIFKIRKVSGSPGSRIRHGDFIALGAVQPIDPSRRPDRQQLRWLEANPDDNDPGTDPVKLGGLSMNPGGDSQKFLFFETNLLVAEAKLGTSDRIPLEMTATGALKIRLSHEGLPNSSRVLVRFTSVDAGGFTFGVNNTPVSPLGGPVTLTAEIPKGAREFSLPLKCLMPRAGSPCARAAGLESRHLGELSIVDAGMAAWEATGREGTQPRAIGIEMIRLRDFLRVSFGGVELGETDDSILHVADGSRPKLVVKSGPEKLRAIPGGYALVASIVPFPAPTFATTAATPVPARRGQTNPLISFAADRSFTHTTEYEPIFGPAGGGIDLYCVSVDVVPLSRGRLTNRQPFFQRYRCQFGLMVLG